MSRPSTTSQPAGTVTRMWLPGTRYVPGGIEPDCGRSETGRADAVGVGAVDGDGVTVTPGPPGPLGRCRNASAPTATRITAAAASAVLAAVGIVVNLRADRMCRRCGVAGRRS